MIKLNESPIRTSRNFEINNIKLENIDIPENIREFKTVQVTKNASILEQNLELTYGIGLEKNIYENSNNKISIKAENNDNIKITYNFDDNNLNLVNQIKIIANGTSNIVIEYKSNTTKRCFHNGIIKLIANENAKINLTIINLLNEKSDNFESIENKIYDNAKVMYTIIDIGGKNSISNYYSDISGENAENDLKTIYLGIDEQIKDINYIAELRGKKSNIDIDVQGALKDNSKKHFKGTIDFKKGCKNAKGNENEYCMLLSDKAKSIALPMLLCTEDNVEGNHSTASGKVDNEQLFYIMTRGLRYKEAVKLIVKANFNKIIERIENEEIREIVLQEIDRRLD
jgi:hypothetical protein